MEVNEIEISDRVRQYRSPYAVLVQRYSDAKCRVNGKLAGDKKSQLWKGLPIMDRDDFINEGMADPEYHRVFTNWEAAGFPRNLAPTAHRINRKGGYVSGNIRWMPHGEKSNLALAEGRKTREKKRTANGTTT